MRKVFEVELSSKNGCTELALPATRYALLDAVEKLELREGERPDWEILQTPACHNIYPYLDPAGGTLSELNALTQRLAQLNEREHAVVEGLAKLAHEQGERPIALSRLIDLAYSTDCCHLVEGVVTDASWAGSVRETGLFRRRRAFRIKHSSCWISQRSVGSSAKPRAACSPGLAMSSGGRS